MTSLVVAGPGHAALAEELARELGCPLAATPIRSFPDGEQDVELGVAARGAPAVVVQPLAPPVGERLLELLLLADACRRAGARPIVAVVPYMGFARQDRVTREGTPLGARVVAGALNGGGLSQVLAVDLHAPVIAACIDAPVVHLTAVPVLAEALRPAVGADCVLVAPDLGAARLADAYARLLGLPVAVVHKIRTSPAEVAARAVAGDVRGRRPVVVDDMISTGATVEAAAEALLREGARGEIRVVATHGLLAAGAAERLARPEIVRLILSDSLPPPPARPAALEVVRLAPLLAEAVRRILGGRGLDGLVAAR